MNNASLPIFLNSSIRPLSYTPAQKNAHLSKVLFSNNQDINMPQELNATLDKTIGNIDIRKKSDFSYKLSSEVVTKRFNEKDFSIFIPPSAMDMYKS